MPYLQIWIHSRRNTWVIFEQWDFKNSSNWWELKGFRNHKSMIWTQQACIRIFVIRNRDYSGIVTVCIRIASFLIKRLFDIKLGEKIFCRGIVEPGIFDLICQWSQPMDSPRQLMADITVSRIIDEFILFCIVADFRNSWFGNFLLKNWPG